MDYSARIQTVERESNPLLYELLLRFEKATGCGVLVNTSFNVRGEPIVCTPDDAYLLRLKRSRDARTYWHLSKYSGPMDRLF